MARLEIDHARIDDNEKALGLCPFNALEIRDLRVEVTPACRMCGLCVKKGPQGAFSIVETKRPFVDKSAWTGMAVFVEAGPDGIHPVSLELIGKAGEMAAGLKQPLYCLLPGHGVGPLAQVVLDCGVDEVFVYDHEELRHFRIEPYRAVFIDFIEKTRPSSVLVGATPVGRSLAPGVAAALRTGLTADCTVLGVQPNTDLDQIRPAFGGNIMAHIRTPDHRPQFATVRHKIFDPPAQRVRKPGARAVFGSIGPEGLVSAIEVLGTLEKPRTKKLENARVVIAAGRAFRTRGDLAMVNELAGLLGAEVGGSRPLIESGFVEPIRQIGLSGRTVKPELIITCGVSGAIQFRAGMSGAGTIVAINSDRNAPIFDVAHYGIVGDAFEIIPRLIERIGAVRQNVSPPPGFNESGEGHI